LPTYDHAQPELGRRQAVRHRILIPAFGGSIPPVPASPKQEAAFLKKGGAKKLLRLWSRALRAPVALIERSLLGSFSSEKEPLTTY
jgi:hypothetical protein